MLAATIHPGFADTSRAQLVALFEAARRFDIRHYEGLSSDEVVRGLTEPVRALVEETLALATRLLRHYDVPAAVGEGSDEPFNFELAMDSVLATASPGSKVADLAFMAVTELRQRLGRLSHHAADGDAWEMLCDAGSAVRRVCKSLAALEAALCEAEHLPSQLRHDSELQISLEVRRQYRKLWRFAAAQGEVQPAHVRNALRGGGTLVAMLVGRDVYPHLREGDRFHLRQLQRRILDWLQQEQPDGKLGVRVWQDFAGMVEMFRQVSLRQELVAHDLERLRDLARDLGDDTPPAQERCRASLASLQGLDDQLDELVAAEAPTATLAEAVRQLLARSQGQPQAGGEF